MVSSICSLPVVSLITLAALAQRGRAITALTPPTRQRSQPAYVTSGGRRGGGVTTVARSPKSTGAPSSPVSSRDTLKTHPALPCWESASACRSPKKKKKSRKRHGAGVRGGRGGGGFGVSARAV